MNMNVINIKKGKRFFIKNNSVTNIQLSNFVIVSGILLFYGKTLIKTGKTVFSSSVLIVLNIIEMLNG